MRRWQISTLNEAQNSYAELEHPPGIAILRDATGTNVDGCDNGKGGNLSTGWSWSPKIAAIASASASAMRPTMKNMGVWPGCGVIRS